ncbi:MAG TPA: hypothetical protein VM680_18415 [Verrucomicrobiae bacterium]|nr:hypothetical protein [Verrucomicrobiae bacterium]
MKTSVLSPQSSQLELIETPPPDPRVEEMIHILADQKGWITAAQLLVTAWWPITEENKRLLRDLASQSDGQIISGQRGYRHIRHATLEEIDHAANWLQHQAVEMDNRARAIRRRKHQWSRCS